MAVACGIYVLLGATYVSNDGRSWRRVAVRGFAAAVNLFSVVLSVVCIRSKNTSNLKREVKPLSNCGQLTQLLCGRVVVVVFTLCARMNHETEYIRYYIRTYVRVYVRVPYE